MATNLKVMAWIAVLVMASANILVEVLALREGKRGRS